MGFDGLYALESSLIEFWAFLVVRVREAMSANFFISTEMIPLR